MIQRLPDPVWKGALRYRVCANGRFQLIDPLELITPWGVLTLGIGYVWDGCSAFRARGLSRAWLQASAAHDALYVLHVTTRGQADWVFKRLSHATITKPLLSWFGQQHWDNCEPWFRQSVDAFARWSAL